MLRRVTHVSAGLAHTTAQASRGKPARPCEAHTPAGERHGGRASRGRGRHGNEGPGGATAGDDRKIEREPIDRVRARLEALLKANAAPRCGARSKRTGKPCRGAAMPNGMLQASWWQEHGAAHAAGPRAQQAGKLETRALFVGSQGGTVARASGNTCGPPSERLDLKAPVVRRSDTDHTAPSSHRHRCQWQGREGFRAQAVQGPELPR